MPETRASRPFATGVHHLHTIVDHHLWATLRLIDRCLELSPEQLELSAPGTFGSVHATLTHLVRSDGRYQRRIASEDIGPRPSGPPPAVAALRAEMERQARRWRELLDRVDELDAAVPADPDDDPPYPEIEHAVGLLLTQAVHHGNEHRAHVCTVLGAHGLDVPDVSGWEYVRLLTMSAVYDPDGNDFDVIAPP
jgi:uncharacterized damage-inducible protein DinB